MDSRNTSLDTLQGWLVLAPLAVLCAPPGFSPFDGAPDTTAIGTGIAALGVIPALLLALLRGRGDRALPMAPLWIVLISAAVMLPKAVDTFGAWKSLTGVAAAAGFVVSGASLGASGRRVLQLGLGVLALVLLLSAPLGAAWTGALGNTGDLSEAALPCAILGAGAFLTAEGILAFAGFAAILLYGLYAGFVPVYAGLAGLTAAVIVAAFGAVAGRHGGEIGRKGAAKRLRILLVALLLSLLPIAYHAYAPPGEQETATETAPETAITATASDSTTGGIAFRRLTWARVPAMIADHLEFGVGPGQFQAAFPPYRDPAEIELSSFRRREPTPNEVEHAHNDWLTAIAEHGPVGGGAFVLFLLIILWRGCRATWGEDRSQRDFGFAAIAILVNAAFNSPLFYGPAAPAIAFAIFGVVGAPPARSASKEAEEKGATDKLGRAVRHGVPALTLLVLALFASHGIALVEYGRALAETPEARVVLPDGREQLDGQRLALILERAGRAAPDSPVVLEKQAQLLSRQGAPLSVQKGVIDHWQRVRPLGFPSNYAAGVLQAKEGDFESASSSFERARSVDPGNPLVLRSLLRVACDLRSPERVEAALADLESAELLEIDALRLDAAERMLSGRLDVAAPLVRRLTTEAPGGPADGQLRPSSLQGGPVDVLDANSTYPARKLAKEAGDELLADAFNVAFQMVMALDHLEAGLPAQAAISAHQALQSARGRDLDLGPILLRKAAAKAAAAVADGSPDPRLLQEAKDILAEQPIRPVDRAHLSEIEKRILRSAGLFQARSEIEAPLSEAERAPGNRGK
ncbi:O-Antigen ligase [Planctomycetes bacterium Poly30]|uniref:O-Antigen ligase n=1 Tax=Saltatorellus ferox TaxID=2528018 RepID=A0A518EQW1_9BACT|nr:O-Antigen ligase [Planctomycetes bacterium Poly30]